MKKLFVLMLLGLLVMGSSFAGGMTQLELAELLVNKAIAEDVLEDKNYTTTEIINFAVENKLMTVTENTGDTVSVQNVSNAFSQYAELKSSEGLFMPKVKTQFIIEPLTDDDLEKLSEEDYDDHIDWIEPFDYEVTNMEKKRQELMRIFAAHALESDFYMYYQRGWVGLYEAEKNMKEQGEPYFLFIFSDEGYNGDENYKLSIGMNYFYDTRLIKTTNLEEGRNILAAMNYQSENVLNALRDSLTLFYDFEEEREEVLNALVESYLSNFNGEMNNADDFINVLGHSLPRSFYKDYTRVYLNYDFTEE